MCGRGWIGVAESRGCPEDRRRRRRATLLPLFLVGRQRHIHLAHVELSVEVREFAARILQEKATAQGEGETKEIYREHRNKKENGVAVGMEECGFVAGHEFQLIEQPKSVCQQEDDGEEQGVG